MTCLESLTGGADMNIRLRDWDGYMYEELANEREDEEDVFVQPKQHTFTNEHVDDWWNRSDRCPLGGSL